MGEHAWQKKKQSVRVRYTRSIESPRHTHHCDRPLLPSVVTASSPTRYIFLPSAFAVLTGRCAATAQRSHCADIPPCPPLYPSRMSEEKCGEGGLLSPLHLHGPHGSPTLLSPQQPGQATTGRGRQLHPTSQSIELTNVHPRVHASAVAPHSAQHGPNSPEDALSEDEEEQIRMEAQIGMLLTAARSHTSAQGENECAHAAAKQKADYTASDRRRLGWCTV